MAVVVQELAEGDRSGVAFSMSPTEAGASVVEAVWGLNQGLVDGTVQPDRWVLERSTGRLREHAGVDRLLGRVERLRNEAEKQHDCELFPAHITPPLPEVSLSQALPGGAPGIR